MPVLSRIVKELLASYNLHPKKRLGQHFMTDPGVVTRIVDACELLDEDVVLEIGVGLGVLTKELAQRCKKVIGIDIDKDMLQISKEVLRPFSNVILEYKDILKFTPDERLGSDYKVVGNLPYYITSPIIERLLTEIHPKLIVLTVQREVAERLVAKPGGKDYGSFTIYVQNRADVILNSYISRSSFYPQPGVGSAVIVLKPLEKLRYDINEKIVRTAFNQRRKMLRSSIKDLKIDFKSAGIDPKRRPETLSLEEFAKLTTYLS